MSGLPIALALPVTASPLAQMPSQDTSGQNQASQSNGSAPSFAQTFSGTQSRGGRGQQKPRQDENPQAAAVQNGAQPPSTPPAATAPASDGTSSAAGAAQNAAAAGDGDTSKVAQATLPQAGGPLSQAFLQLLLKDAQNGAPLPAGVTQQELQQALTDATAMPQVQTGTPSSATPDATANGASPSSEATAAVTITAAQAEALQALLASQAGKTPSGPAQSQAAVQILSATQTPSQAAQPGVPSLTAQQNAATTASTVPSSDTISTDAATLTQSLEDRKNPADSSNTPSNTPSNNAAAAPERSQTPAFLDMRAVADPNAAAPSGMTQTKSSNSQSQNAPIPAASMPQAAAAVIPGVPQAPAGGSASNAAPAAQTPHLSAPSEQMLASVRMATSSSGDSRIHLQLHPESLGALDIHMSVDATGKATLQITADKPGTLALLQNDVHALQKVLTDVGFKTDNSSLSFSQRGDQQSGGQYAQQQSSGSQQQAYRNAAPAALDEALAATPFSTYSIAPADGLDIRI